MSNVMATIQKVVKTYPIDGADAIEMVQVLDYHVVCKKGQFNVGDLLVYCRVDSILPDGLSEENRSILSKLKKELKAVANLEEKVEITKKIEDVLATNTRPEFEFLRGKDFRIKALKYGKFFDYAGNPIISQGICFETSILPKDFNVVESVDVTEILNITKVVEDELEVLSSEDEEEEAPKTIVSKLNKKLMRYPIYRRVFNEINGTKIKGTWQPWMPGKSDEENSQVLFTKLFSIYGEDDGWYESEKLEGQSLGTYRLDSRRFFGFLPDVKNGVCSRNMHLPTFDGSRFWQTVLEEGFIDKLNAIGKNLYIRGEHLGPGIQKNIYGLEKHCIKLYEVFEITPNRNAHIFNYDEFIDFTKLHKFETCPILNTHYKLPTTIQELLASADGESVLAKVWREGVVLRRRDNCKVSFKNKSPEYELRKNSSKEYPGKPIK